MEAYVESVGCRITVEVMDAQMDQTIAQYEADVKRPITPAEEKYVIPITKRFPFPEWRVTFPAPDPSVNVQINYPHDTRGGEWRINKPEFARYLFSRGFTLGINKPKAVPQTQAAPAAG